MTWADFYLFCFAFGFLFSLVTVLTGHLHLDIGGHHAGTVDVGDTSYLGDGSAETADGGVHHGHVSPFNLGTIAAFLAWFGGTGFLTTKFYRMWYMTTLVMAIAAGLAGGWVVYLFLSKVLMRSRAELDEADYDMVGVLGRVSASIRTNGIGEILFSQEGIRRASPARSETGDAIPSGMEVVVTRYEDGIAYVRRFDEMSGDAGTQATGA
jgi:membrane protein implicated in regulation of membrane protease activity